MRLADGNYVFFHNSWGGAGVPQPGFQPAWAILNGTDPTHILARAPAPLWTPTDEPWMTGSAPYTCNVAQVRARRWPCGRRLIASLLPSAIHTPFNSHQPPIPSTSYPPPSSHSVLSCLVNVPAAPSGESCSYLPCNCPAIH